MTHCTWSAQGEFSCRGARASAAAERFAAPPPDAAAVREGFKVTSDRVKASAASLPPGDDMKIMSMGMCLGVAKDNGALGRRVVLQECKASAADAMTEGQLWRKEPGPVAGDGVGPTFRVRNVATGKCLAPDGAYQNGTASMVADCTDGPEMRFRETGAYVSGETQCLDLWGGEGVGEGAEAKFHSCHGRGNQRFAFQRA